MIDTAVLYFIRKQSGGDAFYSKYIRKIPRVGEQIFINDTLKGKVLQIDHHLYTEDPSHIVHIYLET